MFVYYGNIQAIGKCPQVALTFHSQSAILNDAGFDRPGEASKLARSGPWLTSALLHSGMHDTRKLRQGRCCTPEIPTRHWGSASVPNLVPQEKERCNLPPRRDVEPLGDELPCEDPAHTKHIDRR